MFAVLLDCQRLCSGEFSLEVREFDSLCRLGFELCHLPVVPSVEDIESRDTLDGTGGKFNSKDAIDDSDPLRSCLESSVIVSGGE